MTRHRTAAVVAIILTLTGATIVAWQTRDSGAQTVAVATGSGVLTGAIVTDTADPQRVRRATVRLSGENDPAPRLVGSDDDGRFVFDHLPAGRFTLSVSKAGFVQAFYGSTRPGRGPGVPVSVAAGQKVDIMIRLLPGAAISGAIRDARGNSVAGVTVTATDARQSSGSTAAAMRAVTDDRGIYRIFGLAPGEYLVSTLPRLAPAPYGANAAGPPVPGTTDADVQWARTLGNTAVRGGSGTAGGPVQPARPVTFAPVFYPGTTDVGGAATIKVASGEERGGLDLPLRIVAMARLAGTLADGNGQPVSSATVTLVPKRSDQSSPVDALIASGALTLPRAIVTAPGFEFAGVAPGQYTLVARTGGGQRGAVAAQAGAPTLWCVEDIVIDGNDRSDVALRLRPGLTVSGRYVFERGSLPPVDPATLNLSLVAIQPIPGVSSIFRAAVQPDGTFRVPSLAPGSYLVRLDPQTAAGAQNWWLKSAIANDRDLSDRPLDVVADGRELSGVTVTFTDRPAEISGRLIDASSRPVTRYSILVFAQDGSFWLPNSRRVRSAQPATDGSFIVSGLPAGAYALAAIENVDDADLSSVAFLSRVLTSAFKVTLAEGEKKRQDLQIGG